MPSRHRYCLGIKIDHSISRPRSIQSKPDHQTSKQHNKRLTEDEFIERHVCRPTAVGVTKRLLVTYIAIKTVIQCKVENKSVFLGSETQICIKFANHKALTLSYIYPRVLVFNNESENFSKSGAKKYSPQPTSLR